MADDLQPARAPSGTRDVLFPESARWEALVARFAAVVEAAGYGLAHTPIFEETRVFRRGIGAGSDVVGKEMYEFEDRGGRSLALRPEGTAPLVRAFVQHRPPVPWKAWYVTPAFRYERPQAGRYRQHHQLGVEAIGTGDADLDVEVIALAHDILAGVGLSRVALKVHSMGDPTCRPAYLEELRAYLRPRRAELCAEHAERLEANPLRVLDCKRPECRAVTAEAPRMLDHLCEACRRHFDRVREGLAALDVPFVVDDRLVRGFDYYTRTTFEFTAPSLDAAQNGVGGGGRYDGLVEVMGGPPTPGIGFGIGIERLLLACDAEQAFVVEPPALDAFVVDVVGGATARDLTARLRRSGLRADRAFDGRSMRSQLKAADRSGARCAVIVGPDELAAGQVAIRPLRVDEEQVSVPLDAVVDAVRQRAAKTPQRAPDASGTAEDEHEDEHEEENP
ncbi:MAG: histidine--tRNA ligase [Actinomycetota bacterium]|jgi:histidyl-tRNA synthetase|nr:histidine--tRNA ligase [Actinomycetota bacterium]